MKKIFYFVVAMAATVGLWSCAESESDKVRATAGEIVQGIIDKDFAGVVDHFDIPDSTKEGKDRKKLYVNIFEQKVGDEKLPKHWVSYEITEDSIFDNGKKAIVYYDATYDDGSKDLHMKIDLAKNDKGEWKIPDLK